MISQHATLSANYEAVLKQASNANAELSRRLDNEVIVIYTFTREF